ncbi:MAG: cohesin domain-containing protein [Patescibacteria group bacterium]
MKRSYLLILLAWFFMVPISAAAQATLFISPASGVYKTSEFFSVLVSVNTGGQPINAASAVVNFDNTLLDVASLGYSQSIFTLWTEEPKFSNAGGTIRFSGGLPSPGYIGANGSILRVTFKPKASGQAPVVFSSGSVLANDGKGTNILDAMRAATFSTIVALPRSPAPPATPTTPVTTPFEITERTPAPPTITDWPKELEEGSVLTVKGLGHPNGKLLIFIQKGSNEPIVEERFAGSDGRFTYNFSKTVSTGLYRVWAKTVSAGGVIGASSEIVTIEVIQPLFFRIGTIAINYASVVITLLALIVLLLMIFAWVWWRVRKWQERQGIEIHESEKALHQGFEKLRSGLRKYIRYITKTKSVEGIKQRETATEAELEKELKDIEGGIEKEIEDVSAVTKNKGHKHYGHDEFEHRP